MESQSLNSWIEIPADSDFTMYNFPFGIYRTWNLTPHACTALGNYVIDLAVLAEKGYFRSIQLPEDIFKRPSLNEFIALGKVHTNKVRERLVDLFLKDNRELQFNRGVHTFVLLRMDTVPMMLPVHVGDYTDFYSSKEHATNVGAMLRDPKNALLPNWKHLPVAYHGRASSIVVSGTPLVRPRGQFKKNASDAPPEFGPTQSLDFELEIAFIIGKHSNIGEPITVEKAEDHIFGFILFNDWSARDIQAWEYTPLGPFLAKNFMSSASPWIVTTEALAPFRKRGPKQDVPVLPYLQADGEYNFDIDLEVSIQPEDGKVDSIGRTNFKHMYWNVRQQLAHHTVNGCNVNVGDIMASGTISGPSRESAGCLLELTRNGQQPIKLSDGSTRKFLLDGDTVIMKGFAQKDGVRVGFGEVKGKIMPSL